MLVVKIFSKNIFGKTNIVIFCEVTIINVLIHLDVRLVGEDLALNVLAVPSVELTILVISVML